MRLFRKLSVSGASLGLVTPTTFVSTEFIWNLTQFYCNNTIRESVMALDRVCFFTCSNVVTIS